MTLLLCILLYLGAIVSPATYTTTEIDHFEQTNIQQINQVKQDQVLLQSIQTQYSAQAQNVEVIDSEEK